MAFSGKSTIRFAGGGDGSGNQMISKGVGRVFWATLPEIIFSRGHRTWV